MVAEYVARISGDTTQLKRDLQEVRGDLKKISDKEVILKFGYDGNVKDFNIVLDRIAKSHPEITVQLQYDINKKILQEKQKELSQIGDFKLDFDSDNIIPNIKSKIANIKTLFSNGINGDELKNEIDNVVKYINTALNAGINIDDNILHNLKDVDKSLGGYITKISQESKKDFVLFNIDKDLSNTLSNVKDEIGDISNALSELKKNGASDNSFNNAYEDLQDEYKIAKANLADMQNQLDSVSGEEFDKVSLRVDILKRKVLDLKEAISSFNAKSKSDNTVQRLFDAINSNSANELSSSINLKNGFMSDILSGSKDSVEYETAGEILKKYGEKVSASFHTHAIDNLASFSSGDLRTYAKDFEDDAVQITEHFIGAKKELSKIDLSVFDNYEQIANLADQMDNELVHLWSEHFNVHNMSDARNNGIYTNEIIKNGVNDLCDLLAQDYASIPKELKIRITKIIRETLEKTSFSDFNINNILSQILDQIQIEYDPSYFGLTKDILVDPIVNIVKNSIVGHDGKIQEVSDYLDKTEKDILKNLLQRRGFNAEELYKSISIDLTKPNEAKNQIASFFLQYADEAINGQQKALNALQNASGISDKIKEAKEKVEDAAADLVESAKDGTEKAQQSKSPSKVAEALGEYWGEGYAKGIKKHKKDVEQSVRELVDAGILTTEDLQEDLDALLSGRFGNRYKDLLNPLQSILSDSSNNQSLTQNLISDNITSNIADLGEECQKSKKYCDNLLEAVQDLQNAKSLGLTQDEAKGIFHDFPELIEFFQTFPEDLSSGNSDFWNHWSEFLATLPKAQAYLESLNTSSNTDVLSSEIQEDVSTVDQLGQEFQEAGQQGVVATDQIQDGLEEVQEEAKETQDAIRQAFLSDIHQTETDKLNQQMVAGIRETREEQEKLNDTIKEQANIDYVVPSEEKLLPMVIETTNSLKDQILARQRLIATEQAFQATINQSNENQHNKEIVELLKQRREEQERLNQAKEEEQTSSNDSVIQEQKEVTDAIDESARAWRELVEEEENARRPAEAIQEYVSDLEEAKKTSKEAAKSIKEAINISRNQDAGSGLELISQALDDINKKSKEATNNLGDISSGDQTGLSVKDTIKELEGFQKKLSKVTPTGWFKEFVEKTDDAAERLKATLLELKSLKADNIVDPDAQKRIQELEDELKELVNDIDSGVDKLAKPVSSSGLLNQISQYLSKNTKLSREFRATLEKWQDELQNPVGAQRLKDIYVGFQQIQVEARKAGQEGRTFFDQISNRLSDMNSKFIAKFFSFQDLIRYGREAINTIKDLDYQLVDLRKTTTMNNSDLEEFYLNANKIGKQLGTTTSQIIQQAAAWSRLGYNTKETSEAMAEMSSQFAAISPGMSLDDATDGLVSTMKAFHIDVKDTERDIMDNVNRIGNTFATSNGEIMEMLKRSSAAMAAANNTIEETIALESAAVQITRNAETTGTAFRTISMRIRGFDEETEELSEDLKNITGDIADLTKTAKTPGGISVFEENDPNTYKSTYQILKDISEIWDELTDKQQAGLLEKIGGKRGAQSIADILRDFSEVERAMKEMSTAAGAADDEMKIVEDSIEFKINALKETWVGMMQELIDRGTIGKLIDSLTTISEAIASITTNTTALKTAIGAALGVFASIRNVGRHKVCLINMPTHKEFLSIGSFRLVAT